MNNWIFSGSIPAVIAAVLMLSTHGFAVDDPIGLCRTQEGAVREIVSKELGFSEAHVEVDAATICRMNAAGQGKLDVVQAARAALLSFLSDRKDIESPLALATQLAFDESGLPWSEPVPDEIHAAAVAILRNELNSEKTTIRLLPPGTSAEHGEPAGPNWVFRMTAKGLSDHIFWGIVDRAGVIPPYNYGFN
ncbi:MAG: hypothetical protein RIQ81_1365 [Pseudomonadota bacterium]|jgi:hypothetical protein